jgi:hypothetical protein
MFVQGAVKDAHSDKHRDYHVCGALYRSHIRTNIVSIHVCAGCCKGRMFGRIAWPSCVCRVLWRMGIWMNFYSTLFATSLRAWRRLPELCFGWGVCLEAVYIWIWRCIECMHIWGLCFWVRVVSWGVDMKICRHWMYAHTRAMFRVRSLPWGCMYMNMNTYCMCAIYEKLCFGLGWFFMLCIWTNAHAECMHIRLNMLHIQELCFGWEIQHWVYIHLLMYVCMYVCK